MKRRAPLAPEPEPTFGIDFGADDQAVDLADLEGARRRSGIWSEIDPRACGSTFSLCVSCPDGDCATDHCPVKKSRAARAIREAEQAEAALNAAGFTRRITRRRGLLARFLDLFVKETR